LKKAPSEGNGNQNNLKKKKKQMGGGSQKFSEEMDRSDQTNEREGMGGRTHNLSSKRRKK